MRKSGEMIQMFNKNNIHFFRGYYLTFSELMFQQFSFGIIIILHTNVYSMCFLKTLKPLDQIQFEKDVSTDDSCQQEIPQDSQLSYSLFNKLLTTKAPVLLTKQECLLQNLMALVSSNNIFLKNIEQKLNQNEQHLIYTHQNLDDMIQDRTASPISAETQDAQIGEESHDHQAVNANPMLAQLFGAKRYHYKLKLQEQFPAIIFKERNVNISINLVDFNSQKILNSNIIHLCLGVCDANGNWITQNKAGQNFMKGKTEIQMYHGEGSFLKVYPRDVSRNYPEGKMHFVIYSKPSTIQFSSNSMTVEKIVESSEIEPLILSDIVIRAKKS